MQKAPAFWSKSNELSNRLSENTMMSLPNTHSSHT